MLTSMLVHIMVSKHGCSVFGIRSRGPYNPNDKNVRVVPRFNYGKPHQTQGVVYIMFYHICVCKCSREEYGSEVVSVEQSKKEKRNLRPSTMTLHEFLDLYQKKNVYMVQSLPSSMKGPPSLRICLF